MTTPKVWGTHNAAPPVGAGGDPGVSAALSVALGVGVMLAEGEPVSEARLELTVAGRESEVTDAVVVADSTLQLLLTGVLDATDEALGDDDSGGLTNCATMRTSVHWSPIDRS